MDMSLSKPWVIVKDREPGMLQSIGSQRVGRDLMTEQQQTPLSVSYPELSPGVCRQIL